MATRAEMAERTRAALIAAARRLHSEHQPSDVTLGDIATAAGVSKGALYHYWSTKDDLIAAVQEDTYMQLIERSQEIVDRALPPLDELRALVELHVRMVLEHRSTLPVTVAIGDGSSHPVHLQAMRDQIEHFVIDVIRRGIGAADFRSGGDPKLVAFLVLGACFWTARWYKPDGVWSVDQIADHVVQLTIYGVAESP